jgi:hypothetical protein
VSVNVDHPYTASGNGHLSSWGRRLPGSGIAAAESIDARRSACDGLEEVSAIGHMSASGQ